MVELGPDRQGSIRLGRCQSTQGGETFRVEPASRTPRGGLSVSARRRRSRVDVLVDETNQVVEVLNGIYAPASAAGFPKVCTKSQSESHHHQIFRQLARLDRGGSLTCTEREAVLKELLQSSPAYPTTARVYDKALVSIPSTESEPIPIHGLLDQVGRETIVDPNRCTLLSQKERGHIVEKGKLFRPYMDTRLQRSSQEHRDFVHQIYSAGMINFTAEPQDIVSPFFVAKKDANVSYSIVVG